MQEDTSRVMKEPWFLRGIRICGGLGVWPPPPKKGEVNGRRAGC